MFACPYDKLGRIGKKTTGNIRRRIRFDPRYDIQNSKAKFLKYVSYTKNIVICPGYPNCTIICQFITTKRNPPFIKFIYIFRGSCLIPFSFIDANNLSGLITNSTITEKVGRIRKKAIKFKINFMKQLEAISMKKSKVAVRRFEKRGNHSVIEDKSRLGMIAVFVYFFL